jgi:PBP1b-binding outer membrane lipoprotein LpoB
MKKTLLFVTVAALMTSGCSKTWSGIKQDTHEIMVDTKEVIHSATAPETHVTASGRMVNPENNPSVQVVDRVDPNTMRQTVHFSDQPTVPNVNNQNVQTVQYAPVTTVQ